MENLKLIHQIIELGLNEDKYDLHMVDIGDIQCILKHKHNIDTDLYQIGGCLAALIKQKKVVIEDVDGDIHFYAK
tara:strand:+ start:2452 stop:2676 length:225 start_codon:yes stop_codon:yes gene_type:complete